MSLQLLDECVRSSLRSGVAISSISQCIEELVFNSIDAGAQSITIRIDLDKLLIQVIDNGTGVSWDDLQLLGDRYATSKCHRLKDLDDLGFHGYRGEAIASVISCCGVVEFTTRHCLSSVAYSKIFRGGRSFGINICPVGIAGHFNIGTTVTVREIFYNLPVRKKVICDVIEYDKVCKTIMTIALINPNISFTLINDHNTERLIHTKKTSSLVKRFEQLLGIDISLRLLQVSASKNGFKVFGYISTESHYTKLYQFLYINKRFVKNTRLHLLVNQLLSNSLVCKATKHINQNSDQNDQRHFTDAYGVFVINIECLLTEYDICSDPTKTLVEFKRWKDILSVLELAITDFLAINNLIMGIPTRPTCTLPENSLNISNSLVLPNTSQHKPYGLQSKAVQRHSDSSIIEDNGLTNNITLSDVQYPQQSQHHSHSTVEQYQYPQQSQHHSHSTVEQYQYPQQPQHSTVKQMDSTYIPISSSLSTIGQMAANGYRDIITKRKQSIIHPTHSVSVGTTHTCDNRKSLKRKKITLDKEITLDNSLNGIGISNYDLKTLDNDAQPEIPTFLKSPCTMVSKVRRMNQANTGEKNFNKNYYYENKKRTICKPDILDTKHYVANNLTHVDYDDVLKSSFSIENKCCVDKKNTLCTSINRPVMTTYSLINPLSRDSHMTNESDSRLMAIEEFRHNSLSRDGHMAETSSDHIEYIISNDNGHIDNNQSLLESNNLISESHCIPIDSHGHLEEQEYSPTIHELGCSPDINSVYCDECQTNSAVEDNVNNIEDNFVISPELSNATVCSIPFGHVPLRAAPHLSYGISPLIPRAKQLRGLTKASSDKPITNNMSSMLCIDLPDSKWRNKSPVTTTISEWKNPAFSAGDIDILNIGLSSESSSGIKVHNVIHQYRFTSKDFSKFEVLGQVDHKFIACLLQSDNVITTDNHGTSPLLVLFDQHAVHERIRLESLTESVYSSDGKVISIDINPPQIITLSESERRQSLTYRNQLVTAGVRLSHQNGKVLVCSMPSLFCESNNSLLSTTPIRLVKELIIKQLDVLCTTGGTCYNVPITLQHVLNSQACHGAIKFGDSLTIDECTQLIQSLSLCKLPFQCAHGRPSLMPILDLQLLEKRFTTSHTPYCVDTKKLKQLLQEVIL